MQQQQQEQQQQQPARQEETATARAPPATLLVVVLYPGFEPLDVVGPAELLGVVPGVDVIYAAEQAGPVTSETARMTLVAGDSFDDALKLLASSGGSSGSCSSKSGGSGWLLVPGGIGARREAENEALLSFLRAAADRAGVVFSVCTGAALLAAAGLLAGRRATTNKTAWAWATSRGAAAAPAAAATTDWVRSARFVRDGKFLTSGGVSAGMDAAMHLIRAERGLEAAERVARYVEYEARPAEGDPFDELCAADAAANAAARGLKIA